jgi:hypothetical protein
MPVAHRYISQEGFMLVDDFHDPCEVELFALLLSFE